MTENISVPDIGDFESVEVIEVLVKTGDKINKDDPIVTLESDKSSVEVPSPTAGEILEMNVKVGDKVSKGSLLAKLQSASSNSEKKTKIEVEPTKEQKKVEKEEEKILNNNPKKIVEKIFDQSFSTTIQKFIS